LIIERLTATTNNNNNKTRKNIDQRQSIDGG
jgi:hypothetical protein